MPKPRLHGEADCPGTLARVYERPDRVNAVVPIGYVCNVCRIFIPDEAPVMSIADLRPAVEAVAADVTTLVLDRAVHDRFMGIVRQSPALLTAAQTNNPFLNGVRRWWSTATALTLRRHVDPGGSGTLRAIVEELANSDLERKAMFATDVKELDRISKRFRIYFNALIHRPDLGTGPTLTFDDLGAAVETVQAIAQRAYAAVANVSYRMDPVVPFDWTAIFKEPWLPSDVQMAYDLGTPGVPYDGLPMTIEEQKAQANLEPVPRLHPDGTADVVLRNVGSQAALDVRLFLPYARTVIDAPEIAVGASVVSTSISGELLYKTNGQIIVEFADIRDRIFREYADIVLADQRLRRLSGPYLVKGRIVDPQVFSVA
jgi:hypothetical protein